MHDDLAFLLQLKAKRKKGLYLRRQVNTRHTKTYKSRKSNSLVWRNNYQVHVPTLVVLKFKKVRAAAGKETYLNKE